MTSRPAPFLFLFGLCLLLSALTSGAAVAQSDATTSRATFDAFYERKHAGFICFDDGWSAELKQVSVDWRDSDLVIREKLLDAAGEEEVVFFVDLSKLERHVSVHRYQCNKGVMFRVRIDCREACKLRRDDAGGLSALLDLLGGLFGDRHGADRHSGEFYLEFASMADADRAACLVKSLIEEAQPCADGDCGEIEVKLSDAGHAGADICAAEVGV